MAAVEQYAVKVEGKDAEYIKNPSGWLNARRWEDEIAKPEPMVKRRFVNVPN